MINYFSKSLFALVMLPMLALAQKPKTNSTAKPADKSAPKTVAPYETVPGDPMNTRIYTLKNGLKVYLSVYKNEPRIQTYIAVKAGSKNDPADATGLAHYLEHMLFKGTDKFGSKDFAKEEPMIKQIENLYEVYRKTKDPKQREKIYHQIDSVSGVAATYAIANEYDKMTAAMGCRGTNAFTSVEQTVYVNDIPSNQLENWITMEAERFRKPVLRLFHTELEAVYEEKNRGLDNDNNQAYEQLMSGLFKKHTYGTQTTIGTIDHLKNPSMTEINKYFYKNYVPNNMAICMSGDFDPDQAIKIIEAKFGGMQAKPVPAFKFEPEAPITAPIVKEVLGPNSENVMMGFRFGGAGTKDADLTMLCGLILSNGKAGLFDLDLNQSQKVLNSFSYFEGMKDYSTLIVGGEPKEGQKLEDVSKLVLEEIEKLKKGEFADWLIPAIITDIKYNQTKEMEENSSRAIKMAMSFTTDKTWSDQVNKINRLSKLTKQEVVDFAKKNFGNNYVVVYKRIGENPNAQKVDKPAITPVPVNREDQSPFLKNVVEYKAANIEPVFLDYSKDLVQFNMKSNIPVLYTQNKENQTFDLFYVFDMGSNNDKVLPIAIDYLPYLGTSKLSAEAIQKELYKFGSSFNVFNSADQVYVNLNGLTENFDKSVELFESLLSDAQPDKDVLDNLVADKMKAREDAKLEKNVILRQAMYNYGVYGAKNPFTNVLSDDEMKALKPEQLVEKIKKLSGYEHRVLYYGTKTQEELKAALNKLHNAPDKLIPIPAPIEFKEQATGKTVYVVDYEMKQVEILMVGKGVSYNSELSPGITLYNEYFGGGMSGIVFQELRESRALAYSVQSAYRNPAKKDKSYYSYSYIGSQADKLPEAMGGMYDLLNNMPQSDVMFSGAKDAVLSKIRTERITKSKILFTYEQAKKMGLDYDIRKSIYDKIQTMSYEDLKGFQTKYVKDLPLTVLVLGKKDKLDIKTLEKYGTVKYLTLKDVFGY
ncbi:MAG: peptidase domain protein [Bacteroidetes bacterium]|jgi:predicted Zn-dependent peptidase|nr:peptidase domain protein [Bacteroidota bacterium]